MGVDQDTFTPLVFIVPGGMRGEGRAFYLRMATLLSLKNGLEKSKVTSWRHLNLARLRRMLLCLRGS